MHEFVAAHIGQIVFGVFAFIILLIILAITSAVRANKRRSNNIREWAFRSGYDFTPGPMPAHDLAPIAPLEMSGETVEANARNIARGSRLTLFDFDHATRHSSGVMNNRTQYTRKSMSCALFKVEEPLPRFSFSPMAVYDQNTLAGKMMAAAIHIADHNSGIIPIADRPGFLLHTDDDVERVKSLLREPHFFDDKCGWGVQSTGSWMLLTCNPVEAENYDKFRDQAQAIYDHFRHSSS